MMTQYIKMNKSNIKRKRINVCDDEDNVLLQVVKQDQEVIRYHKLIVPMSMRSSYWKHYGFPADECGNILTKQKIICSICKSAIAYNKNTTNLRTHLQAKHLDVYLKIEKINTDIQCVEQTAIKNEETSTSGSGIVEKRKKKRPILTKQIKYEILKANPRDHDDMIETLEATELIHQQPVHQMNENSNYDNTADNGNYEFEEIVLQQNHNETNRRADPLLNTIYKNDDILENAISELIITDLFPTNILQGQGFQNFIWTLYNTNSLPTKMEIENNINKMYDKEYELLINKLKYTNKFSLSIEKWYNIDNKEFLTIYINSLNMNNKTNSLEIILFKIIEINEQAFFWSDIFKDILEFNILNCSGVVVNFTDEELKCYLNFNDIPMIYCFANYIQSCVDIIFADENVKKILDDVEGTYNEVIKNFDNNLEIMSLDCKFHKDFWITKWNFLNMFCNNITTINDDLLYDDILKNTKDIVECLKPLKIIADTLSLEKYPIASIIRPLVIQLIDHYFNIEYSKDSKLVQNIKNIVKTSLEEEIFSNNFLTTAAFLDPRFKELLKSDEICDSKRALKKKIEKNQSLLEGPVKQEVLKTNQLSNDSLNDSCRKGLSFFFTNTLAKQKNSCMLNKDKIEIEFNKYLEEESTPLEQCPINWWTDYGILYPHIKKCAEQYICVPAYVNNNFCKKTLNDQIIYHNKRFNFSSATVEKILFLNNNRISQ